jgi:hypothetical protein
MRSSIPIKGVELDANSEEEWRTAAARGAARYVGADFR